MMFKSFPSPAFGTLSREERVRACVSPFTFHLSRQRGFTLVEMIVVIVITGILGAIVAIFIRAPVQGYVDSARRAEMTDIADSALRRITRDVRLALPNSVRITGTCTPGNTCFMEYLETVAGGRYRGNDCFSSGGCTQAVTLNDLVNAGGLLTNGLSPVGMRFVVYNQYSNSANDCSPSNPSAYCAAANGGAPVISSVANATPIASEDTVTFPSTRFLPAGGSPNNRFEIVSQPVTYACTPVAGGGTTGVLRRYWGYVIQPTQPNSTVAAPLSTASNALLATNVSACSFTYNTGVLASQRNGLVSTQLTITESGESVTLYNATHVSNVP